MIEDDSQGKRGGGEGISRKGAKRKGWRMKAKDASHQDATSAMTSSLCQRGESPRLCQMLSDKEETRHPQVKNYLVATDFQPPYAIISQLLNLSYEQPMELPQL